MVFANGYHGGTLTFTDNAHPMNLPHEYVWGTFNDIEKTRQVVQPDIAAVIVEPMQGAGGLIMATKEFLQFVREMATEIGAVLIFDEVITSRLRYGGLQEYFDVYPDMTTLGKYVGGGFSFGAFGGSKEIMARLDPRLPREDGGIPHSGTYNNNIFTMKAGIAAAKIVTPDAISRCNDLGDKLREGFRALLANRRVDYVGVSGFGSLIGIHFTGPHSSEWRDAFFFHMLERGVYTGRRGFMNLNLAHGHAHIDKILAAISAFVDLLPSS